MKRLLIGTALIAGLAIAAPAFAATPGAPQPLGGPYTPETAPTPPSTIAPGYAYQPYWGGFNRRFSPYSYWRNPYRYGY